MPDAARIQALEERLVNAWPSLETQLVEGWLLRFANGYSKRANSASPLRPGAGLDAGLIDHIVAQFDRRGIRPCFRLTGLQAPETEAALAARGLIDFEPSLCLVAPLPQPEADAAICLDQAPSQAWIEQAAASYGGDKADPVTLGAIVSRISNRAGFATLCENGQDRAWGFAVAERGHVGLYDIVVAPQARARGFGRRLVLALMRWGAASGADTAYLQVRTDNAPARRLYASLGFTLAYAYTHRVHAADRP